MNDMRERAPDRDVVVKLGDIVLGGFLCIPDDARGIVLFVHGSGSSRFSPRNRYVAEVLNERGLATLLFDLLTPAEHERDALSGLLRFDTGLLSRRTIGAVEWVSGVDPLRTFPLGLFGASTGAAAALNAAAARPDRVSAVVSRGGRPDLAMAALPDVQAPTLLIVGAHDYPVIDMNQAAAAAMNAPHRLAIVEGATHLFEEPGTLEQAAKLAADWFTEHLPDRRPGPVLSRGVHHESRITTRSANTRR